MWWLFLWLSSGALVPIFWSLYLLAHYRAKLNAKALPKHDKTVTHVAAE